MPIINNLMWTVGIIIFIFHLIPIQLVQVKDVIVKWYLFYRSLKWSFEEIIIQVEKSGHICIEYEIIDTRRPNWCKNNLIICRFIIY